MQAGLIPRILSYLFERIPGSQLAPSAALAAPGGACGRRVIVRISMVQIQHEVITDLLNPAATRLAVRETLADGVTVVGASEITVQDGEAQAQTHPSHSTAAAARDIYYIVYASWLLRHAWAIEGGSSIPCKVSLTRARAPPLCLRTGFLHAQCASI